MAAVKLAATAGKVADKARVRSPLVTAYGSGVVGQAKARGDGVDRVTLTSGAAVSVERTPVVKTRAGVVKAGGRAGGAAAASVTTPMDTWSPGRPVELKPSVPGGAGLRDGASRDGAVRDGAAGRDKPIVLGGMIDVSG